MKTYETPVAEKIEFCYQEQIVASGSNTCANPALLGTIDTGCVSDPTPTAEYLN